MASDFVKYIDLKKAPVYALKGKIPPKFIPEGVVAQELEVDPPELDTPLKELIFPGNFRPIADSPFRLGDPQHGEIKVTAQGMIFMGIGEAWVMIGSAIARYK